MDDWLKSLSEPLARLSGRTVWLCALFVALPPSLPAQVATEYEAKAALLFNFIKFVRWPEYADANRSDFVIAVPSDSEFGASLKSLEGKKVKGRTVRLVAYFDDQIPQVCDVVVVGLPEWKGLPEDDREELRAHFVLTVSEEADFTRRGGVLSLFLVEDHLAFDINAEAARAAKLEISANLLNLAHSRRGGSGR